MTEKLKKMYPESYKAGTLIGKKAFDNNYDKIQLHNYYGYFTANTDFEQARFLGIVDGYNLEKKKKKGV